MLAFRTSHIKYFLLQQQVDATDSYTNLVVSNLSFKGIKLNSVGKPDTPHMRQSVQDELPVGQTKVFLGQKMVETQGWEEKEEGIQQQWFIPDFIPSL